MEGVGANFFSKLEKRVESINSMLCVGLDPHKGQLAQVELECAVQFCMNIIEKTHLVAAAFKPNIAFFEAFGGPGLEALQKVIAAIPSDIPVILDCKRGDIDSTAMAYADSSFNYLKADCVTLSPYMGWDSIAPFVTKPFSNKGAFLLCKTSNKTSSEIQDLTLTNGNKVYEQVVSLALEWNARCLEAVSHPSVGLVVGATDSEAMKRVRSLSPEVWILCPGVGSQGGDLQNACLNGLRSDGSGMLISVSRGISGASDITAAALQYRNDINVARQLLLDNQTTHGDSTSSSTLLQFQKNFIQLALDANVLQFGQFTLKSGRSSPYFFNAGNFSNGLHIRNLGRSYAEAIHRSGLQFDVLFGPAYKGIPIATSIAVAYYDLYGVSLDVGYNRKEAKDHGEGGVLVGAKVANRRVLVVDDVITAGTAIRESMTLLQAAGALVVGVTVCLDRQERGSNADKPMQTAIQQVEEDHGVPVVSIVKLEHLVTYVRTECKDSGIVQAMSEVAASLGLLK